MPQRYSISANNNVAIKEAKVGNIGVGAFKGPAVFDNSCRAAGPVAPPDNMTFQEYIRQALISELKIAGAYNEKEDNVVLSADVEKLSFSSSRGLTGGSWDVGMIVRSSNGRSTYVSEHYEFNSGFVADTACKQTAEAFLPTVQNLIEKLVKSREFKGLVASN
ncbi:hypothetical protein [Laribacter hongkongensis]|uniref:hypothetical protein n=1 Tax=Laribacter hongkongensis TaxID=168471 RepID=UPI001EFE82F7|nr:hypothetical protein [Laribacter hongkongensis]MCG9081521.1 hypothetical protein [Laribacter hongkongensis]